MNDSHCPECGAAINPGRKLCPACLLSAGVTTIPVAAPVANPGIISLPMVFGDYHLLKKLGAGGMGTVFEAEDMRNGRRVALKLLSHSLDTEEQRKRFLREGRLAATIDHPNSVYVFGADEINGVPVISMELAAGGTLRDLVKRSGPLPVGEAVDLILDIIDGLEAAHAKGILHRDMKPSNCFVTGDGKAMVGDFGLSISQNHPAVDGDQLTRSGLIMGTPAFAPPEQLRGQPLDLRADIYSTAGTLYYLLTGKPPVEKESAVETVAAVLEGRIPPVHKLRTDVPDRLANTIMRSLSADAARRPATYGELRAALMPFNSKALKPAPLHQRFLAGLIDTLILTTLCGLLILVFDSLLGDQTSAENSYHPTILRDIGAVLGSGLICIAFYGLLEGFWGMTPGKWVWDLRVGRADNSRPGVVAATLRATMFEGMTWLASLITYVFMRKFYGSEESFISPEPWLSLLSDLLIMTSPFLLLLPALFNRERIGWHDRLTGLRVWRHNQFVAAQISLQNVLPRPPADATALWGPFHPGTILSSTMRCGFDPVLSRSVMLTRRETEAPCMTRRKCSRGARLRWMQCVKDLEGHSWDVWQAPAGAPLLDVLSKRSPSWRQALSWLVDLTAELNAAQKEDTLPPCLSMNHVWLTVSGRAILLDQPWPETGDDGFRTTDPQAFLYHLTQLLPSTERPLHADRFVLGLKNKGFERLSHISGNLAYLKQQRSTVSKSRRALLLLLPILVTFLPTVMSALIQPLQIRYQWAKTFPGQPLLSEAIWLLHLPGTDDALKADVGRHIAGHYGGHMADGLLKGLPYDLLLTGAMQDEAIHILQNESPPDREVLAKADLAVRARLAAISRWERMPETQARNSAAIASFALTIITALAQLIMITLVGSPLLMRLGGIAAVSASKRPARRWRMIWRWIIGWSPFWTPLAILSWWSPSFVQQDRLDASAVVWLVWLPLMLAFMITVLLAPGRNLLDRLAGTWLVAR